MSKDKKKSKVYSSSVAKIFIYGMKFKEYEFVGLLFNFQ